MARDFMEQIHYPTRRWIVLHLAAHLRGLRSSPAAFVHGHTHSLAPITGPLARTGDAQGHTLPIASPLARIGDAVLMLFDVLSWLAWCTGKRPLLAIDQLEDLTSDRLRCVGGQRLFEALATLAVKHSNPAHRLYVAVAGSPALLLALRSPGLTAVSPGRWAIHCVPDLPYERVYAALAASFGDSIASKALDMCGLRALPLSKVLQARDAAAAAELLRYELSAAHGAIQHLLAQAGRDEEAVRSLLSNLYRRQEQWLKAQPGTVRERSCETDAPPERHRAALALPYLASLSELSQIGIQLAHLPDSVCTAARGLAAVLYLVDGQHLVFQSAAVLKAWAEMAA